MEEPVAQKDLGRGKIWEPEGPGTWKDLGPGRTGDLEGCGTWKDLDSPTALKFPILGKLPRGGVHRNVGGTSM